MKYSVHFKKDGAVIAGEIDARDYADCRAVMQQMFGNDIVIFQITVAQTLNERGCIPPHTVSRTKRSAIRMVTSAIIAASITLQSTVARWLGATGCLINDPAALCAHNSAQARV